MAVDRRAVVARLATVRARTTVFATVVVGAALGVGSVVLVLLLRQSLISNLDQAAILRARDVAAEARQGDLPPILAVAGEEQSLVQVVRAGRVIASSANLRGEPPLAALAPSGGHQIVVTRAHLPVGEQRPYVSLTTDRDHVLFRVEDDGSGVPPEYHERVFERFARLDEARSRDGGGAGWVGDRARDRARPPRDRRGDHRRRWLLPGHSAAC